MALLDDLAARLVAQGVGVVGTSIFLSTKALLPVGDGPMLTLIETGGSSPTRTQNLSRAATVRPSVQVVTRAKTYPLARTMAHAAYLALDGLFNTVLNGTMYLSLTARQEPNDLTADDLGRARVAFNVDAEKSPS